MHNGEGAAVSSDNEVDFLWLDYGARNEHNDISLFLGERQKIENRSSFLVRASDLLQKLNEKGEDKLFESQFVEWLKTLGEIVEDGLFVGEHAVALRELLNIRMHNFREKENEGGFDSMDKEIKEFVKLIDLDCETEALSSCIVEVLSGKNILNRRHGIWCVSFMKNVTVSVYLLSRVFEEMNPDESIDIVDSLGYSYMGVRSEFGIVDKLVKVDVHTSDLFWNSVLEYANKAQDNGYDPLILEWVSEICEGDKLLEKYGYVIPVALKIMIESVEHKEHLFDEVGALQDEIIGNTAIGVLVGSLREMKYYERYKFLKEHITDEEPIVIQFLSTMFNKGMPYSEGVGMDTGDLTVFVDQLSHSKKVKKLWELVNQDSEKFLYQVGLMLAHVPVRSLSGFDDSRYDVVEKVRLIGSNSSLCGFADIYMTEAINSGHVRLLENGKLIYKNLRAPAALCLQDFVADSGDGVNRVVFKRGCYYSPRGDDPDSGEWRYVRPVGGDEIPRASGNLLRLADKCAKKIKSVGGV